MVVLLYFFLNLNASFLQTPYIDNISINEASIGYETDADKPLWLSWGEFPRCDRYIMPSFKKRQILNIYGLKPQKKYCYNFILSMDNSTNTYIASSGTFTTFYEESISSFNFIVIGNTGLNNYDENIKLSYTILNSTQIPLLIVHTGNIINYGFEKKSLFNGIDELSKNIPVYNTLGPMEYGNIKEKSEGYKFFSI